MTLSEQVAAMERMVKCTQDLEARLHCVLGERDALIEQNKQLTKHWQAAAAMAIHPPMVVQQPPKPPEGTAFYYENNGITHTQPIQWAHSWNYMNPVPREIVTEFGIRWRRLMWKKDVAHQNRVVAFYVEEPR